MVGGSVVGGKVDGDTVVGGSVGPDRIANEVEFVSK